MPKITMEFSLPEEREEFQAAEDGARLAMALDDFKEYLRKRLKYEEMSDEQYCLLEAVQKELFMLLDSRDIRG